MTTSPLSTSQEGSGQVEELNNHHTPSTPPYPRIPVTLGNRGGSGHFDTASGQSGNRSLTVFRKPLVKRRRVRCLVVVYQGTFFYVFERGGPETENNVTFVNQKLFQNRSDTVETVRLLSTPQTHEPSPIQGLGCDRSTPEILSASGS